MIDLIIPYYNNPNGLQQTIDSINQDIFYITIVDDNSDKGLWLPNVNQVLRVNKNYGPGWARQLGIDKTNNPYIMFIDTGDIFISKEIQQYVQNIIIERPELNFISFPYFHEEKLTTDADNRMHGKVYKREFIQNYGITFTSESSYMDEDVGFNRACRLCTDMTFIEKPIIRQIKDENSLTYKDNNAALYRDQNRALALVSLHTVDICEKNNINAQEEINQIAIALYYWFIRTAAERPEYIQESWSGARIFYTTLKNRIKPNNIAMGNVYLKKCLQYRNQISFPINILRFADDIQKNEIVPDKYLTSTKI